MRYSYRKIITAILFFVAFTCLNSSCCMNSTMLWKNVDQFYDVLSIVAPHICIPLYTFVMVGYLTAFNITFMCGGILYKNAKILKVVLRTMAILWIFFLLSFVSTAVILYKSNDYALLSSKTEVECDINDNGNVVNFSVYENERKLIDELEHNKNGLDVVYGLECKRFIQISVNDFKTSIIWYFIIFIAVEGARSYALLAMLMDLEEKQMKHKSFF